MSIDPSRIARYEHGSRIPGWDDAVDLEKDPAGIPDPASTPVPEDLRAEIEAHMARYARASLGRASPRSTPCSSRYGWCTPEGIEQAACVMRSRPAT